MAQECRCAGRALSEPIADHLAKVCVQFDSNTRPLHVGCDAHGGSATYERIEDDTVLRAADVDASLDKGPRERGVVRSSGFAVSVRFDKPQVFFSCEGCAVEEVSWLLRKKEDKLVLAPRPIVCSRFGNRRETHPDD